ncbi:hypothetical protein DFH06DRAFT_465574 [Mycena polygramma]|nr:hypothetical protein DFH06DRAFT_465574 [Mycena polygramma]
MPSTRTNMNTPRRRRTQTPYSESEFAAARPRKRKKQSTTCRVPNPEVATPLESILSRVELKLDAAYIDDVRSLLGDYWAESETPIWDATVTFKDRCIDFIREGLVDYPSATAHSKLWHVLFDIASDSPSRIICKRELMEMDFIRHWDANFDSSREEPIRWDEVKQWMTDDPLPALRRQFPARTHQTSDARLAFLGEIVGIKAGLREGRYRDPDLAHMILLGYCDTKSEGVRAAARDECGEFVVKHVPWVRNTHFDSDVWELVLLASVGLKGHEIREKWNKRFPDLEIGPPRAKTIPPEQGSEEEMVNSAREVKSERTE